ncbi:MAG: ABC transporter ATP-binding protein [Bacilli bacterium]
MNNENKQQKHMGPPGMGGDPEKAKNFKQSVLKLIKKLKPYFTAIIVAIILAILSSIFSIIGPSKLSDITNEIVNGLFTGIDLDKVKSIFIFLITIYSLSVLFGYIQGYIMATVTNKFSKNLRNEISNKINILPLKFFDNNSYGDILSRVTNDVDTIGQTMSQSVVSLISAITLLGGVLIMMFITNWIMASTAIIATILGFLLMMIILTKSQKYFTQQQQELGSLNGHIEEIYSGHNVVKVYNGLDEANNKFDEINNKLYESARKSQFMSGLMQPIMSFIGNFGYVSVCVVGAMLVINGDVTMGTIVSFMIYVRIFTNPLMTIAQATTQLQSAAAASERVFKFLEEEEMTKEVQTKVITNKEAKGNIEFEHVKFGYNEDKVIINDFSAKSNPGDKIAIVGPTGAGKTTMVNLLMKFYEINSGDIKIDGVSTKDLTRENIHDLFVMVLQDSWIFNGSVKENIKYNKEDVTDAEIKRVCEIVGIDHFIKTLPDGYDTILADAESISAGQKQLLTIARGMIENKPFLILDEATSSVDTRTEELVQKAMDKLMENRTSFIIAHRLSTIKNADLILVMKDGNIIEQGNHEQLMKQNGFYFDLYNSQFQN